MIDEHQIDDAHVDADSDLITRLGEELFTDSLQALLELVKNSYDADAQRVRVEIDTGWTSESAAPAASGNGGTRRAPRAGETLHGRALIIDEGVGMEREVIERGWLVISSFGKREQKRRGTLTRLGRMPLGDKGLGRLGAQRLATRLVLRTRPRPRAADPANAGRYWNDKPPLPVVEHLVMLDFRDFRPGITLHEIPVDWTVGQPATGSAWPAERPWGTVLELQGLKNVDDWLDEDRLRRELSRLINPYERMGNFRVAVEVDGRSVDPERIGQRVRASALATYSARYDGNKLIVTGKLRPEWLNPEGKTAVAEAVRTDGGAAFVQRVQKINALKPYRISRGRGDWLLEFKRATPVDQLGDLPDEEECGPFRLELDQLALQLSRATQIAKLDVFGRQREYAEWVKQQAGVPVYRDGFHVAPGSDLLRLGEGFTGGGSWYSLRPQNVLGYIAISAAENAALQETTDREDFRNTPAYRRFRALIQRVRDDINRAVDDIGRAAVRYNRDLTAKHAEAEDMTAADLAGEAKKLAERAGTARAALSAARERATMAMAAPDFQRLPEAERQRQEEVAAELARASDVLAQVERFGPVTDVIAADVEQLDARYRELYETTGLGIVAEALVHDLTAVVRRLQERARLARAALRRDGSAPAEVTLLIDEVDAAAKALRGQLRHLDPQMRGARTRRQEIDLRKFVKELAEYHQQRLLAAGISVELERGTPATIWAAPGRLAQVLDNLIINSEYWLGQAPRQRAGGPVIRIAVDGSTIRVSDNGPGIPVELGESVFEPFVSNKAGGRGLGLFIVRQLLDSEHATVSLAQSAPDRPLDTFVIDLSNARRDG